MFILKIVVTYVTIATGAPGVFIGYKMVDFDTKEACEAVEHTEKEKVRAIFERNGASVQTVATSCNAKIGDDGSI
jgi:hypothetical protein